MFASSLRVTEADLATTESEESFTANDRRSIAIGRAYECVRSFLDFTLVEEPLSAIDLRPVRGGADCNAARETNQDQARRCRYEFRPRRSSSRAVAVHDVPEYQPLPLRRRRKG